MGFYGQWFPLFKDYLLIFYKRKDTIPICLNNLYTSFYYFIRRFVKRRVRDEKTAFSSS